MPARLSLNGRSRNGNAESGVIGVALRSAWFRGSTPGLTRRGTSAGEAGPGQARWRSLAGLARWSVAGRATVVVVVGVVVATGLVRGGGTSAEPTVYQFLLDWEQGDYRQAAALTTGQPGAVALELKEAYGQLDATRLVLGMRGVSQHGSLATAEFGAAVELGGTGREWKYENSFGLRETAAGWRVVWSPAVIAPGLTAGDRLAVVQQPDQRGCNQSCPSRAMLVDDTGQPLIVPSLTYQVGVNPQHLRPQQVDQIAYQLATVFGLQEPQVAGEINALPSHFDELITLSPGQYAKVRRSLAAIPGLQVRPKVQRLFDSIAPDVVGQVGTEVAPVLRRNGVPFRPGTTVGLSGLQQAFQHQLTGTPTIGIVVENAQGVALRYLSGAIWSGAQGTKVRTTIDGTIQVAANRALSGLPSSAAIVAIQASTGKVLAVASHKAVQLPPILPLLGKYQPGQAFTIVSAAALLASGQVGPASQVQCLPSAQVDGRRFVNEPAEPAAMRTRSTFARDFAMGCSTAFSVLSMQPQFQAKLMSTAAGFGIGVPWRLPVGTQFPGTIGTATGEGAVAADAVGTGDVRLSPLDMALAAGAADVGRWHAPSLVSEPDPPGKAKAAMSPAILAEVQSLMRETVASGRGAAANVRPDVFGQVGSAGFGSARAGLRISWFVGYEGDVAFAVAELGKTPAPAAATLAGSFLRDMGPGS
jgi:cell division protein FtsI/penicillin-binding protein 2